MKRGRKQDDTLPPSRSREIQRAFRQRRSDYIGGLEARVSQLEAEVDQILARHNEPLRYTTPEVVAARSASRKKQRTKSKHSLPHFLDANQAVEAYDHSPSDSLAAMTDNSGIIPSSSAGPNPSMAPDVCAVVPAHYFLRDMNGEPTSAPVYSKGPYTPFTFGGPPDHQHEYSNGDDDSATILARGNQRLLHPWNGPSKAHDLNGTSPDSPGPPSSQFSHSISAHEYQCPSSQIEMLMGMDQSLRTPAASSQLMSSFDFRHEVRVPPPSSCSLPPLVADSSPQSGQLFSMGFHSYTPSSADVDSSPSAFRSPHSQMSDRYNSNSCYPFMDSSNDSSPHVPLYRQESPFDFFRPGSLPGQHTLPNGSLSTLIIAATRLDHFEPPKSECSYPTSSLLPSPALGEGTVSPDLLGYSESPIDDNSGIAHEEYGQPDGTTTPIST
ncbi:hypothetical protein PSTG_10773 [Puccinia striiformis f. sp. tritici PST-78]|uniref:BZIP domain-containing protein n=1 Tax=Puccinia striiformis f. sp. tritici PST-78 TaxID=1165861 RepID=A0A0L0V985_9BASI|nr:hypothetical protein PSTG_10773 [Puccinia striiformis f. sp. tritici PST-78]